MQQRSRNSLPEEMRPESWMLPRLWSGAMGVGTRQRKFLELVLNPMNSKAEVMQNLRISEATYFRWLEQSKLPVMRVNLSRVMDLPVKSGKHKKSVLELKGTAYALYLAAALSRCLGIRFEVRYHSFEEITKNLTSGKCDLEFSFRTRGIVTPSCIDFSHSISYSSRPQGVLMKSIKAGEMGRGREVLGVIKGTLHENHARKQLNDRFRLIAYSDYSKLNEAISHGRLDYLFCHPSFHDVSREGLEIVGQPVYFAGQTALGISQKNPSLVSRVNKGLEALSDTGILQKMESRFFGVSV